MKNGAEGLQKIAVTGDAQQLPPGTTVGMAIGAEIAPDHPGPIRTGRIGAEMVRSIDLTAASARHDDARGWGGRGVWVRSTGVLTGVAVRLGGEALKRCEGAVALAPGWRQSGWCWAYGSPVTWPRVMEQ